MNRAEFLAGVLGDADVMWAVITANVKIAGPWARGDGYDLAEGCAYCTGRRVSGGAWHTVASVTAENRCACGQERSADPVPCAECGEREGLRVFAASVRGVERRFEDRATAEAWCDATLRACDWLIVTRDTPDGG